MNICVEPLSVVVLLLQTDNEWYCLRVGCMWLFHAVDSGASLLILVPSKPLLFGSTFLPNLKSYQLIVLTCAAKEPISQTRLNHFIPNDILFNQNYWLFNSCIYRRWWKSGAHGSDSWLSGWSFKAAWDVGCVQRYCSEVKGMSLCYCVTVCYYLSIDWVSNWMHSPHIVSALVARII